MNNHASEMGPSGSAMRLSSTSHWRILQPHHRHSFMTLHPMVVPPIRKSKSRAADTLDLTSPRRWPASGGGTAKTCQQAAQPFWKRSVTTLKRLACLSWCCFMLHLFGNIACPGGGSGESWVSQACAPCK